MFDSPATSRSEFRRRIALCLVAALTLTLATVSDAAAQSRTYTDVAAGRYYTQPIAALAQAEVFEGTDCGEGLFCPDQPILRWEMAVWVVRVVDGKDPAPLTGGSRFGDVAGDLWWAAHVERMYELGITSGCGDGADYCPNEPIKRAHMAVFLARAFDLTPGPHAGFVDVNPLLHWFHDEVIALARSGITTGCGSGSFCATEDTTRAQMATFLHRAVQRRGYAAASCSFTDHADRVTGAVFQVHADGLGTAFLIGDVNDNQGSGLLWLTAAHVVGDRRKVTVANGDTRLEADVLGIDQAIDTAMLRTSAAGFETGEPLRFGRADWLKSGADLYAVGYPLHEASQPTVSKGVLSRIEKDASLARVVVSEGTLILTDAPINPGNSGGPLVDACGSVIGMNVAGVSAVEVEGINWAVAESTLQERYESLKQVSRAEASNEPGPITQPPVQADWERFEGERFEGTYIGAGTYDEDYPFNKGLLIRCTNNAELHIFVVFSGSHMIDYGLIEIRFSGQEDTFSYDATTSTDNKALFIDDHDDFLLKLRNNHASSNRLFIRLWTYFDPNDISNSYTYHGEAAFGIIGFDKVVEPVVEVCDAS